MSLQTAYFLPQLVPIYQYHAEESDHSGWRYFFSTNSSFGQDWTFDGLAFYAFNQPENVITVPNIPAYALGTGDFTIAALVHPLTPGTLIARTLRGPRELAPAFVLSLRENGQIVFVLTGPGGQATFISTPTNLFDGDCHYVAGVRQDGRLHVYVDGTPVGGEQEGYTAIDVTSSYPIRIGSTSLTGMIYNVGVWNTALSSESQRLAMFNRPTQQDDSLLGYWTLNGTTADRSPHQNTAVLNGAVTFVPCRDCVWAQGQHAYAFYRISNEGGSTFTYPRTEVTGDHRITLQQTVIVEEMALALYLSTMDDSGTVRYPEGVLITLTDPIGRVYNQNHNTEELFVYTHQGSPWAMVVKEPVAGPWKITLSAPASIAFTLQAQTIPTRDWGATVRTSLTPLFPLPPSVAGEVSSRALEGSGKQPFFNAAGGFAFVIVLALATLGSVPAAPAAVLALGVATLAANFYQLYQASNTFNRENLNAASVEMTTLLDIPPASTLRILILDPDNDHPGSRDEHFKYEQRQQHLYPYIDSFSHYKRTCTKLIGRDDNENGVHEQLTFYPNLRYVSATGEGWIDALCGWQEVREKHPVLWRNGNPKHAPNKIFHLFSSFCGETSGLGQSLVSDGALAFIGYNDQVRMSQEFRRQFCAPDIEIDKVLINGGTVAEAHSQSIKKYNEMIQGLKEKGFSQAAKDLEHNRDALVSPVTDPRYGDKTARIEPVSPDIAINEDRAVLS